MPAPQSNLLAYHVYTILFAVLLIIYPSPCRPQGPLGVNSKSPLTLRVREHLMPLWAQQWSQRPGEPGRAWDGLTQPRPPPCSNTKCYYLIDGQFIILFFTILCFYIAVRKSEIKIFQKKIYTVSVTAQGQTLNWEERERERKRGKKMRRERFEQSTIERRKRLTLIPLFLYGAFPQGAASWWLQSGASQGGLSELKGWNWEMQSLSWISPRPAPCSHTVVSSRGDSDWIQSNWVRL